MWTAVVRGLARVLQHFSAGAASGRARGRGAAHPRFPVPGKWVPPRGPVGVNSCGGAWQHPAASAGILLGSGEFSPPPALPLPLCFLAEASVPFHCRGGAEQEPACAACASRRECDAGWESCRARHLPCRAPEAKQQLRGSPSQGLSLRRSEASRQLVSLTKRSFALTALLAPCHKSSKLDGKGPVLSWALGLSAVVPPRSRWEGT